MKKTGKILMATALLIGVIGTGYITETKAAAPEPEMPARASVESDADERIYCVGSVSKVYVTTAVMKLVDQGLVELDETITTYIPDFTMEDDRYQDITVRMLMDHTSGIMGTSALNMFLYDDNYKDDDYLLNSLSAQRLTHAPGEYAAYCNDGFDLLMILVENVTGMDYTDYVLKNIAAPVGALHTGSPFTLFKDPLNAPITIKSNIPHAYDYCMDIGAGGIYATASDVANFGSAFFKGSDLLLSETSKADMATRWNDKRSATDLYQDANGLGWDYVESLAYEKEGVSILGKGGDIDMQHAFLLVAPDQEISVSVLSSGGGSNYNELLAQALLNVALEEQGIVISELTVPSVELVDEVPAEYRTYEGMYVFSSYYGPELSYVYFDDHQMHVQHYDFAGMNVDDYSFTSDGGFVSVDENGVPTIDLTVGCFEENENGVYIKIESYTQITGIGIQRNITYAAERINPNPISKEAISSWAQYSNRDIVIYNARYSATDYAKPFGCLYMIDEFPGLVYLLLKGVGGRPLYIEDENFAISFTTMPCSSNRDLLDAQIGTDTLFDGTTIDTLSLTNGWCFRFVDELPTLDSSVTEIALYDNEAQWFVIGDDVAGSVLTVDRSSYSTIYVYNKYHEVVYSTNMLTSTNEIPLPAGGYIMFVGENGDHILIN